MFNIRRTQRVAPFPPVPPVDLEQNEPAPATSEGCWFRAKHNLANLKTCAKYLGKITFTHDNKYNIILATFGTTSCIVLNIISPFVFSKTIVALGNNESYSASIGSLELPHWALMCLFVTSNLASQYSRNFRDLALIGVNARAIQNLVINVVRNQLENKSLEYHKKTSFGDQVYIVNKSIGMTNSLDQFLTQIIPILVEIMIALIILSQQYDYTLAIFLASMIAAFIIYSLKITPKVINSQENLRNLGKDLNVVLIAALQQYKVTHDFCRVDHILKDLKEKLHSYMKGDNNAKSIIINSSSGHSTISHAFLLCILLRVGYQVVFGILTLADFIYIANYLLSLGASLPALGKAITTLLSAGPDWMFVIKELSKVSEVPNPNPDAQLKIDLHQPVIEFENVDFTYETKNDGLKPIFNKMNFKIKAGQKVYLVGENGCGKSSIFNLLFRYYLPNSGKIAIYGQDILADVGLESLRKNISIVPQNANLFKGTVRENILSGAPNPAKVSDKEILDIAESAGLKNFITKLGLETQVGENGGALSGGQQQKIAILRSLMKKDASILLLDEITSALDHASAIEVLECIEIIRMARNLSIIAISHDSTEIEQADEIIVIGNQGVVAKGNHLELISRCDVYGNLYRGIKNSGTETKEQSYEHI